MSVSDRFQVLCPLCGLVATHLKKTEAIRHADRHGSHSGDGFCTDSTVFDLMARRGFPQTYTASGDVIARRPTS